MDCPICCKSGLIPGKTIGTFTQCTLCWGIGTIPPLHVIRENEKDLAVYYWVCNCHKKMDDQLYQRVHPSNHDVGPTCDMISDQAELALAGYVQALFANIYKVDLDFIYP